MHLQTNRIPLRGFDRAVCIDTDLTPQTGFAHRLCQSWAAWSYGAGKLSCTTFARLVGLPMTLDEAKGVLYLSEEQLLAVDHGIAQLDIAAKAMLHVHYRSSDCEPMDVRYRRLNVTRAEYRSRRQASLAMLYQSLKPDVDRWRHLSL